MAIIKRFFEWYNSNYHFHLRFAALLFLLQFTHLVWLTGNVVIFRFWGMSVFPHQLDWLIAAVDYTEIPALISISLVYINDLFLGKAPKKAWLYLLLLNIQWIHLFWITDEVVLENFTGEALVLIPAWLSWTSIVIDYLEMPVMYDAIMKTLRLGKKMI